MTMNWFGHKVIPPGKVSVSCPICSARLPVDIDGINSHMDGHRVVEPAPTFRAWAVYRWRRMRSRWVS